MIEGIDTILHIRKNVSGDAQNLEMLEIIAVDASNSTRAMRSAYHSSEAYVAPEDRNPLLASSDFVERLIGLVSGTFGAHRTRRKDRSATSSWPIARI